MPAEEKSNIKLGLFVLAGLFLVILTLYIIGKNQNLFGSNFEVKTRFRNVNGLMKGNNIRFSGIQVGTVKSINLIDDTTIEITMLIDNKMKAFIHKNTMAAIGTEGLMGNKIINLLPGKEISAPIAGGDLLPVQKGTSTDEIISTLDKTSNNFADISENLKITVHRINSSAALWGILNEPSLAVNLKSSLRDISKASAQANGMTSDLHTLIRDIRNGKGPVGYLLTDTGLTKNLQATVGTIKAVGDKAVNLSDELNQIAENLNRDINSGQGTVHALLKDSSFVTKLNASLDNVQKGTAAFGQDMEALKHNFLFRGYFRKLEKQQKKQMEENKKNREAGQSF